jgi:hypothetical protein
VPALKSTKEDVRLSAAPALATAAFAALERRLADAVAVVKATVEEADE